VIELNCRKLVNIKGMPKLEWLKWRQKGIGGSDVATVFGINPWSSTVSLYFDKTETIKPDRIEEENIPAELGNFLEPFIEKKFVQWCKKAKGWDIETIPYPFILQHKSNDIALANLDGLFRNPENGQLEIIEYKSTSERNYQLWIDENLPEYYYLQVQWYLYITGLQKCYMAFLIGKSIFNVTEIDRNDEVIDQLVDGCNWWWEEYIMKQVCPAPDGSFSTEKALQKMFPQPKEGSIIELPGFSGHIEEIARLAKNMKADKETSDRLKQEIKLKMGDNEVAVSPGDGKKFTWKVQYRKGYTTQDSKSRVFRISKYEGENK